MLCVWDTEVNLSVSLMGVRGEINVILSCSASQGVQDCILASKMRQVTKFHAHSEGKRNVIAFVGKKRLVSTAII